MLNKNKEVDWFEIEKERSLKYRLLKKNKKNVDSNFMKVNNSHVQ